MAPDYTPLSRVALDFKWLPSWEVGKRIRCLNIMCIGSRYQATELPSPRLLSVYTKAPS